jgi:hypothetical protein
MVTSDPREVAPAPERFLLIGRTTDAFRTCTSLSNLGFDVEHLGTPTDAELAAALGRGITRVAVLLHSDPDALRYCLMIDHLRPGIPIVVALFDKTIAAELRAAASNCVVMSPADIAIPSLVAGCLAPEVAGLSRVSGSLMAYSDSDRVPREFTLPRGMVITSRIGKLTGQLKPHDSGSQILLIGLVGLLVVLVADTIVGMMVLNLPWYDAFNAAVRIVATVGPVAADHGPVAYVVGSALAMLATIGLTAMFTAGIVEHLLSGRLISLWGRRVIPQRGHVVVVGMGQVGLRLAAELKALKIGVIGIETNRMAPNIRTARAMGIPVLVGDGSRRRTLLRARADQALALCTVSSQELDNISCAVTARAISPTLRVVLRAGTHEAIADTTSLFRIGTVCDVAGLTAAFVAQSLVKAPPSVVVAGADRLLAWQPDGSVVEVEPARAECGH